MQLKFTCRLLLLSLPFISAQAADVQIDSPYFANVANFPKNYKLIDWSQKATGFYQLALNSCTSGEFLPLMNWDSTNNSIKIPSYVGKVGGLGDGGQEGVTVIATVLGAGLNGMNVRNANNCDGNSVDYVEKLSPFINRYGIVMNNINAEDSPEFWYMLTPALELAALYDRFPSADSDQKLLTLAQKWKVAVNTMYQNNPQMAFTSFDFAKNQPVLRDNRPEPEVSAGAGMLMLYAYQKTHDASYLTAAKLCASALDAATSNPLYENLEYLAPLLQARINALEHNNRFDVAKQVNYVFSANSETRTGWGMLTGSWLNDNYDINGLLGSTTDTNGYAFAMNTFYAVMALSPLPRYDQRYARLIGKWLLHVSNGARYFYSDSVPADHQDQIGYHWQNSVVPYEGLRHICDYNLCGTDKNGRELYATGDPVVQKWGYQTNLGMYSGALVGVMSSVVQATDQVGILQVDLLKTDFFHEQAYPTFMYYNPFRQSKTITVTPEKFGLASSARYSLFDSETKHYWLQNVRGAQSLIIPSDSARVIVVIPAQEARSARLRHGNYYINERLVARQD